MTATDTPNATAIPTKRIDHSDALNASPNLASFSMLAPNITGIAKKKVNSAAVVLEIPSSSAPMIVAPDRHMTFMDLATGRQLWRIKSRKVRETTGISDDGEMFYAKTMDGEMIAVPVDADTYTEAWTADAGWGYDHNPCPILTRDGVAYMANRTGMIAAVDESDGRLLGAAKIASAAANDFTADDNGGIWVSFIDGRIFRIGLKTAGK